MPLSKEAIDHQKCIETLIFYFQQRNINCIDLEQKIGSQKIKRPDLLLPDDNTLIEVKILLPQEREQKEKERIEQELGQGKVSTYWHPEFFNRFEEDLKKARRKFRNFPDFPTLVIFFDFHSNFHRQEPERLLLGQEYITIAVPKDIRKSPYPIKQGLKNRSLRRDKNKEIGAIAFHCGFNSFKVYHNDWADDKRKIDKKIFNLQKDKQWEFTDNSAEPFKSII